MDQLSRGYLQGVIVRGQLSVSKLTLYKSCILFTKIYQILLELPVSVLFYNLRRARDLGERWSVLQKV